MTNSEPITLTTFTLGLNPYVVIESIPDPESPEGFDLKVKGGRLESKDELICLLLLVVENLTGVSSDLYVKEIDLVRRTAGLTPLNSDDDDDDV